MLSDAFGEKNPDIRRTWCEINLDFAKENFLKLKRHTNAKKLCAVIKANAYGHGAVGLAELYSALGCDFFAVSNLEEATELRGAGIAEPILVLGYIPPSATRTAAEQDITLAVYSEEYAKAISAAAASASVLVKTHLKFDTGMGRLGFLPSLCGENSLEAALRASKLPNLLTEGAFTHFATADGAGNKEDEGYTELQISRFKTCADYIKNANVNLAVCHASNSAGVLSYPNAAFDMVRLGISLYGLAPSPWLKNSLNLRPVMSLKSVISHIKTVPRGTSIGYGRAFVAKKRTRIATVPIGYADGLFRSASAGGVAFTVRGKPARIIGRVCMDQTMIDITDIPQARLFDEVTVFGQGACESAEGYAQKCGTIAYEAVCAVSARVPRLRSKSGNLT